MLGLGNGSRLRHAQRVAHLTNIKAFVNADANEPLFRLYAWLCAVEIAMKDAANSYPLSHDLQSLAGNVFGPGTIPAGVQAALTQLTSALSTLLCTFNGQSSPVYPPKYPGIRYLRLQKDGFVPGTTDADVVAAMQHAEDLVDELRRSGKVGL